MDKNKHNDWTDVVRDRLESRELTPSDALWERIDAAVPEARAAAPRKVRRLAWGGAIGVAAAAALAAVLFLRPAGTREDGRVDIVTKDAAPLAMQQDEQQPVQQEVAQQTGQVALQQAEQQPRQAAVQQDGQTAVQQDGQQTGQEVGQGVGQIVEQTAVRQDGQDGQMSDQRAEQMAGKTAGQQAVITEQTAINDTGVSLEDYLTKEEKKKGRHSLTASVFAAGRPSSGIGLLKDYDEGIAFMDNSASNPSRDIQGSIASSENLNYTTNPENPDKTNTVKYSEDPYNLSGERLNHSRPVSVGVAVTYPLENNLLLESGVYYSYLHSSSYLTDQTLHSVGIPLKLGYRFASAGRTSLALSAGAKAEKCLLALRGGDRFKEPGIQLAAVGSAAVQYDFTPRLGLFVAPELSYWFTETKLPTYNTEHPFNLTLKAGINLKIGN